MVKLEKQITKNKLAPIVLFTYNRVEHLKKTLESLSQNSRADESVIFIFSDGYKSEGDKEKVENVRKYLNVAEELNCFNEVHIICAEKNQGLAQSIINGVSKIIEEYSRVIVIEDDVVTTKDFLDFMNKALDYYEDEEEVWSVGGYSHPMHFPKDYMSDVYAVQRCSSYCWGTWKNRWETIDWTIRDYGKFKYNFCSRYQFNRSGNDMAAMLDAQMNNKINSWAIRFDYNMWKKRKFNILPVSSKACNIGHDGSGTHANIDLSKEDKFYSELREKSWQLRKVKFDTRIVKEYRKIFQCKWSMLVKGYVKNVLLKW